MTDIINTAMLIFILSLQFRLQSDVSKLSQEVKDIKRYVLNLNGGGNGKG